MLSIDPLGLDGNMLDGVRSYLRIDAAEEIASLSAICLAAIGHAERFTGQFLLRRAAREILSAGSGWQSLSAFPIVSVTGVTGIPAEGASFVLAPGAWEAKIGSRGEAHLRVLQPGSAGRVEVTAQVGLAADWDDLPEVLRLALLRLGGHFYAHRDASDDAGPPLAVSALLRPWRRMRL